MTTETKFTPGPWAVRESSLSVSVVGLNGEVVFHESDKRIPGVMGDARLIAAAPDLLEALQQCAESMRDAFPDFDHFERPAYKAAVDAIAKATGGEEGEKGDD